MTPASPAPFGPEAVTAAFAGADGRYRFARWGRPLAPVVLGCDDATLALVKGALEAVAAAAGHPMAAADPELGANLVILFVSDWAELADAPGLGIWLDDAAGLAARLAAADAARYAAFALDAAGAIRAGLAALRVAGGAAERPADEVALDLAVRAILAWGPGAFADRAPLALAGGRAVLRPEVAALVRAAYDPVLPDAARDASHALRLAARLAR